MLSPYRGNANAPTGATSDKPILVTPASGQGFPIEIGVSEIIGGTVGRVLFEGTGNVVQQSANLFWDNTNAQLLLGNGSVTNPAYSFNSSTNTGMYQSGVGDLRITTEGTDKLRILTNQFILRSNSLLQWGSSGVSSADLAITRDAANTLAQRNGTNAQTHNIYNTFTDASNWERGTFAWASNIFNILAQRAGTGSARQLRVGTGGSTNFLIMTNNIDRWRVDSSGNFLGNTDNTLDIGATGATRPRTIYLGTSVQIEANAGLVLTNQTSGPGAAVGTLTNAPSAGDPDFWLPVSINGTAHWIPAWAA